MSNLFGKARILEYLYLIVCTEVEYIFYLAIFLFHMLQLMLNGVNLLFHFLQLCPQ